MNIWIRILLGTSLILTSIMCPLFIFQFISKSSILSSNQVFIDILTFKNMNDSFIFICSIIFGVIMFVFGVIGMVKNEEKWYISGFSLVMVVFGLTTLLIWTILFSVFAFAICFSVFWFYGNKK